MGWSVDGSELIYVVPIQAATATTGNYRVYALAVQTGTSRLILNDPRWRLSRIDLANPERNRQSPDGQFLYAAAQGSSGKMLFYLYRINLRQTSQAVVLDSSSTNSAYLGNDEALLSADGNRLAYQYRSDSVRVHNLANKTSVRIWTTQAIAFSPDGSQLLVSQPNSALYRIVSLTTPLETVIDPKVLPINQTSPLSLPEPRAIRWHSEGIRYIYGQLYQTGPSSSAVGLFLWNITQQKSTLVWSVPEGESGFASEAWALNGQPIVFISSSNKLTYAGHTNYVIHSTDPTTLKTTIVATGTQLDGETQFSTPGRLRLSPDNTKLAYILGSTVYIAPVQP